jgi:cell division protein ZapA (FtsZ GTPase activity inhibitor)
VQKAITILGRTYTLRADQGEDLEQAAADVDKRVRELMRRSPAFDPGTAAILTALNLASELRNVRARARGEIMDADHQLAAVEAVLEAALSQDGADEPDTQSEADRT